MAKTTSKRKAGQICSEDGAHERGNDAGGVGSGARPSKKSAGTVVQGQPKSSAGSTEPWQLQFPAEVWGHILEFMFYEDVRSALLICKLVANDAVKHVQTITVMKSSQLDVPAARRFPSVRALNIYSLLKYSQGRRYLCADTAKGSVLFATCFPNLSKVSLGGLLMGIIFMVTILPWAGRSITDRFSEGWSECFVLHLNLGLFAMLWLREVSSNLTGMLDLACLERMMRIRVAAEIFAPSSQYRKFAICTSTQGEKHISMIFA